MRKFISALPTKEVDFMDSKITIRKLSAGAIKRIGKASKDLDATNDDDSLTILSAILKEGVVLEEGEEITMDLLEEFPLEAITGLSNEIMTYAGLNTAVDGENNTGNAS